MLAIKDAAIIEVRDAKHRKSLEKRGYSIYETVYGKDGNFKRGKLLFSPC